MLQGDEARKRETSPSAFGKELKRLPGGGDVHAETSKLEGT